MEREQCSRCGGVMRSLGRQMLQKGELGWHLRGDMEKTTIDNLMPVEIWCCEECRHLDFYMAEPEDQGAESGIAMVRCPYCGCLHEMDDAKCPQCGKRLY